jgi:hypothetical protein
VDPNYWTTGGQILDRELQAICSVGTGPIDAMTGDFPVIEFVTLVAANGDELETCYYGNRSSVSGSGTAECDFTGGTGRFEDATRHLQTQAGSDTPAKPIQIQFRKLLNTFRIGYNNKVEMACVE